MMRVLIEAGLDEVLHVITSLELPKEPNRI